MKFTDTDIPGLVIIEPALYKDSRGYFFEAFSEKVFTENGLNNRFVQDNQSRSAYGVIRGLHYQLNPFAQAKLVRVLEGEILDVAVDIRKKSPTFGKHFSIVLSVENNKQLLIPPGFAHGFSVLSENATVFYKCDKFYSREAEGGILYNDPALEIDWNIPADKIIISEKDISLPLLSECRNNFDHV